MLSLAGCISATHHQHETKWSLSDDLAVYQRAYEESGRADLSVFPAYLRAATQLQRYRDAVEEHARNTRCKSWLVVQNVEIESAQYEFLFLCRTSNGTWSAIKGSAAVNDETELRMSASPQEMDKLLARTYETKGVYYRPIFDARCVYVTAFNEKEIARFAVYAPVDDASYKDSGHDSASALVNALRLSIIGDGS